LDPDVEEIRDYITKLVKDRNQAYKILFDIKNYEK